MAGVWLHFIVYGLLLFLDLCLPVTEVLQIIDGLLCPPHICQIDSKSEHDEKFVLGSEDPYIPITGKSGKQI